jgi:hypothetical protein
MPDQFIIWLGVVGGLLVGLGFGIVGTVLFIGRKHDADTGGLGHGDNRDPLDWAR